MVCKIESIRPSNLIQPVINLYNKIVEKIANIAKAVFGYIVRIVVFQMGVMKTKGAYWIIRTFQILSSDPREKKPFSKQRLDDSKNFLISLGGKETFLTPEDNNAKVHTMSFTSKDFYDSLDNKGAKKIKITYQGQERFALLNLDSAFAKQCHFEMIPIERVNGQKEMGILLPVERKGQEDIPTILHCHSPGRSMCMDRKFVALHLAAGYNVVIWDPRGTVESTGDPTEGGIYLDAEAVYNHVRQTVEANRIYVSGYCEGAAYAAHLKKKFHKDGVHMIASNTFPSMKEVISSYGWLGRLGLKYGLDALQNPKLPNQDGFDIEAKLKNLPQSTGQLILIHTDTDKMMPRGTVQRLCEAFNWRGPYKEFLRIHPNIKANGHMQPPYEDPFIWKKYTREVV